MAKKATNSTVVSSIPKQISNFELFILLLSVLSVLNVIVFLLPVAPQVKQIFLVMGNFYCIFFLVDFFIHLKNASSKSKYFFKEFGFLDLLGSIPNPAFAVFRIYRIVKYARILRQYTVRRLIEDVNSRRAESALFLVFFILIFVVQFGGALTLGLESKASNANIVSASDALWWGVVTVTTVGYGDRFPVTDPGRMVGVVLMFVGVGTFGVLTSYLANTLLAPPKTT